MGLTETYECRQCHIAFTRAAGRGYQYCSRVCASTARVGRPTTPKRPPIERVCGWCGAAFTSLATSAGARISWCSRSCQNYAKSRHPLPRALSATEAAYLAAIIDGEGWVGIIDRTASRPGATRPTIRVSVAGTHTGLMDWLVATTGTGRVSKQARSVTGVVKSKKQCYAWTVSSLAAIAVLRQAEPYMIEKRDRALAAIASQPPLPLS